MSERAIAYSWSGRKHYVRGVAKSLCAGNDVYTAEELWRYHVTLDQDKAPMCKLCVKRADAETEGAES